MYKNPCYLCARMCRGYSYSRAKELGCNKIALGHHYDDVIETILIGMLHGGQVQTMMKWMEQTVLFATVPLERSGWEPVPFMQLLAFREAELRYRGTQHPNECLYNEEAMKQLFMDYSLL